MRIDKWDWVQMRGSSVFEHGCGDSIAVQKARDAMPFFRNRESPATFVRSDDDHLACLKFVAREVGGEAGAIWM